MSEAWHLSLAFSNIYWDFWGPESVLSEAVKSDIVESLWLQKLCYILKDIIVSEHWL